MLTSEVASRLEKQFHSVSGGWCCASKHDPGPRNHGFRLPVLPSEGVAALRSQERSAGGLSFNGGADFLVRLLGAGD